MFLELIQFLWFGSSPLLLLLPLFGGVSFLKKNIKQNLSLSNRRYNVIKEKNGNGNMNQETVFQLLQKSEWEKLLDYEYSNQEEVVSNPILKSIFDKYFIDSLLNDLKNKDDKTYSYVILKRVYQRFLQHRNKTYNIPDKTFENLVIYYLEILQFQKEIRVAQHIANNWNHLDECQMFLQTQPKEIEHSSTENIKISENSNIIKESHIIPLFKSKQEYEFL